MISMLKRLLPEFKPHIGKFAFALLLGAILSGLKALIPDLFTGLTDAWEVNDKDKSLYLPFIICGVWIIVSILRFFHMYIMRFITEVIAINFRKKLMNKYLRLDLSYVQNFQSGSGGLMSRMMNDIVIIQHDLMKIAVLFREPILILLIFGYLLYIDWKLVVIILIAAPIITQILKYLGKKLRAVGISNQEKMEELTKTLKESLDGTRIVQSFNLEDELNAKFDKQADDYLELRRKIVKFEEAAGPLSETISTFALAVLLVYIGTQILDGQLKLGQFLSFSIALTMLSESIRKVQQSYIKLQQVTVAVTRMNEVLNTEQMVPQVSQPEAFPKSWDNISFNDVSFKYGEDLILNKINLNVKKGEMVALVGTSGGGKTTLVNLLPRFFDVSDGNIKIGDTVTANMKLSDLRDHIALVSQDVFLFSDTIKNNIQYGSKTNTNIEQACKYAYAHDFIMKAPNGYDTEVGEIGSKMSGGQKQRLSIARAFLKDAPILILDEATSALDYESEQEVQKGLQKLMVGRTVFVIAHRLSTVINADKIIVLDKGKVCEQGTHDELVKLNGEYAKLYHMQNH